MKKISYIFISFIIIAFGAYYYLNNRTVTVIDVHQDKYTVAILVDQFPLTSTAKISWWVNNRENIVNKYNIKSKNADREISFYIFIFGEGYQELGKKDRLCFEDIAPPKNCIDKNLIMRTMQTREGDTQLVLNNAVYIQTKEGKIYKSDE